MNTHQKPIFASKKKKNAKTQVSDMKKYFFSKPALMNIHTTHHIYKIAVRKKFVWKFFFVRDFSSAAPNDDDEEEEEEGGGD